MLCALMHLHVILSLLVVTYKDCRLFLCLLNFYEQLLVLLVRICFIFFKLGTATFSAIFTLRRQLKFV